MIFDIELTQLLIILGIVVIILMICCVGLIYCMTPTTPPKNTRDNPYHVVIHMPDVNEYIKKNNTHCVLCRKKINSSMTYNKCGHNFHIDCKEKWDILGDQYIKKINGSISEPEKNACLKCPNCYNKYIISAPKSFIDNLKN